MLDRVKNEAGVERALAAIERRRREKGWGGPGGLYAYGMRLMHYPGSCFNKKRAIKKRKREDDGDETDLNP